MRKIDPKITLPPSTNDYQIFNSHCHLNDDSQFQNVDYFIDQANNYNVTEFVVVGFNQLFNKRAIDISKKHSNFHAAVGWHPDSWQEYTNEKLLSYLTDLNLISMIGEIGLDYHYSTEDHIQQQQIFRNQLQIAKQYNLPVSIHTRDAFDDTIKILKEENITRGVIHNFNTNVDQAYAYLDQGLMLSISGVVTFKNAKDLRESLQEIPIDRLLVETDDPYLTPEPLRGHQNHPAYVYFTLKFLSDYLNIDIKDLAFETFHNTEVLINEK